MLVCDDKVVHEDFKFLGNESNRYLLELKRVCLLNKIHHHLIRLMLPGFITVIPCMIICFM